MSKKIFILNISSEPELIYVYQGHRITKQRSDELSKKYQGKIKFITKELINMRVHNPDSPNNKLEEAILDIEVGDTAEDDINDLIQSL